METTEITGQEAAIVEMEQTVPAAEPVAASAAQTVPVQVGWLRKHRTAAISAAGAAIVIAGLAIGAISYGNHVINQSAARIPGGSTASLWGTAGRTGQDVAKATVKPTPAAPKPLPVGATTSGDADLPAGEHAYHMNDGSYVVVAKDQPLPAPVVADLTAYGENLTIMSGGRKAPTPGASDLVRTAVQSTGKEACVIMHVIPDPAGIDWSGYAYVVDAKYYADLASAQGACSAGFSVPATEAQTILLNY